MSNADLMMKRLSTMALNAGNDTAEEAALMWAINRIEALEKFRSAAEVAHGQEARRIARISGKIGEGP